jgi:aminoglycoside phosphotransferase (APT) family kinase protein
MTGLMGDEKMEKGPLIGQGRTAEVYAWGSDRVLKYYQSWMPAVAVEREFAVTRLAHAAGLPVPAADELIEIEGRLGIVFERVEGISLLKVLENQPWKIISISRQLAELHAGMHTCILPPEPYTQHRQIERGIELTGALSDAEKATVRGVLARLPEGEVVCHGDFHPDNILITSHGPVIIDWITGTRGHPLGDVARTILLLQTGGLPPGIPFHMRVLINASRALLLTVYLNRYLQLHPAARRQVDEWRLPILAARLFEVENYPEEKKILLNRIKDLAKGL